MRVDRVPAPTLRALVLAALLGASAASAAGTDLRSCVLAGAGIAPPQVSQTELGASLRRRYRVRLSDAEHRELALRYLKGLHEGKMAPEASKALDRLAQDFSGLIHAIATRAAKRNPFIPLEELESDARKAFMLGIRNYDPDKGAVLFYMRSNMNARIQNAVLAHARELYGYGTNIFERYFYWGRGRVFERMPSGRTLLPGEIAETFNQWLIERALRKKGLEPTPENYQALLAAHPGRATPEKVIQAVSRLRAIPGPRLPPIDLPDHAEQNTALESKRAFGKRDEREVERVLTTPSHEASVIEAFSEAESQERLAAAVKRLDANEKLILRHYLLAETPLSLNELGARLLAQSGKRSVSRTTALNLKDALVEKLRAALKDDSSHLAGALDATPEEIESELKELLEMPVFRRQLLATDLGDPRLRYILERHLLAEKPLTLQAMALEMPSTRGGKKGVGRQTVANLKNQLLRRIRADLAEWFDAGAEAEEADPEDPAEP